jgi:hypothetical protein
MSPFFFGTVIFDRDNPSGVDEPTLQELNR